MAGAFLGLKKKGSAKGRPLLLFEKSMVPEVGIEPS